MGEMKFDIKEINKAVVMYVDKYLKRMMSNVKFSFLDKYNDKDRPLYNCIYLNDNEILFSYNEQGIEKVLSDTYIFENTEITVKDDIISDCLNELSERERKLILRNIVLKTPLKEIALDMGLSERMIKYYKKKALEKIKRRITENGL